MVIRVTRAGPSAAPALAAGKRDIQGRSSALVGKVGGSQTCETVRVRHSFGNGQQIHALVEGLLPFWPFQRRLGMASMWQSRYPRAGASS